jgi:hypothetical protein
VYFGDYIHLTDDGANIVANALAETILELGLDNGSACYHDLPADDELAI